MTGNPGRHREGAMAGGDLLFLSLLSAAGFAVGLIGIFHYGYMGQDFSTHRDLVLTFPSSFSYALTNPPGLYWFGSFIREHLGAAHGFEFTALAFLALNSLGLCVLYGFVWRSISGTPLRYAAAALLTFVPFRVIHSIVLAADALTLPIFAAVALFTFRLCGNPRSGASWTGLSLSLTAGMLCKYTFAGLLPAVAVVVAAAIWRRAGAGRRLRSWGIGALALAIPASVFLLQWRECAKLQGDVAVRQWLPDGAPPVMRWSDILIPKKNDARLLSAPDYLGGKLYGLRNYSYLGLLHVSSFTDVLGYFQPPPQGVPTAWSARTQEPFVRERSPSSQALQTAAVRLCLVFSILAVAGTLVCVVRGGLSLLLGRPLLNDSTVVVTALATGFYSTVFFSLHRLGDPYTPGFWLPRLVLPALVVFLGLGFVPVDSVVRHSSRLKPACNVLQWGLAAYTLLCCLLFIGFLT